MTTSHTLVIAEKPSVARSIAGVIGADQKQDGYLEGNGYLVSWCIGHLVSLADAGAYDPALRNGAMRICRFCRKNGSTSSRTTRKSSLKSYVP